MTTSSAGGDSPLRHRLRAVFLLLVALFVIGLSAFVSQPVWRETGLRALQAINEPRVELIANALRSEINRQDHLPVVLSLDRDVRTALATPNDAARVEQLSQKLQRLSVEADARALYVIGRNGIVLASGTTDPAEVMAGRNYAARSYFLAALERGRSTYLGVDPATNRVRYYLAEAIRDEQVLGVAVVRIDFDPLETAWERGGEKVLITDADGVVFLASDPQQKYRSIGGANANHLITESAPANYPDNPVKPVDMTVSERRGKNAIVQLQTSDGEVHYLYQTLLLPEFGWTIHRFVDLGGARGPSSSSSLPFSWSGSC
jgi:two-component system C4-dicarboxylate transport sensor histidine kinase DctB